MGANMKRIVVSAINFTQAGPLATLKECLEYLEKNLSGRYQIIAIVNDKRFFDYKNIKLYTFPLGKKSWLVRLYYEYIYFYFFSRKLKPHLWLSLHDITPNVKSDIRAVYVLNPSPFYKLSLKDVYLDFRFTLFNLFYGFLYSINIKRNNFVVVQQNCLKNKFKQLTGAEKIIVAHPSIGSREDYIVPEVENSFFFPALPRVFKNFEIICEASDKLIKMGVEDFQVLFTISGRENRYARHIYNSYKHIKQVKFLGIQSRDRVYELYRKASCVIFPSKLETWGLPISEAKLFLKPILLADLEYAHETLGTYNKAKFFNLNDAQQLAEAMRNLINKTIVFDKAEAGIILKPFAQNWKELFDILLSEN